jgi:hypothetical protein
MTKGKPLYSVGTCPTCGPSSGLIVLRSVDHAMWLVHCPFCARAWTDLPATDEADPLDTVSGGRELCRPALEEIRTTRPAWKPVETSAWDSFVTAQ